MIRIDITGKAPMLLLEIVSQLQVSIKQVRVLRGGRYAHIYFDDLDFNTVKQIEYYIQANE